MASARHTVLGATGFVGRHLVRHLEQLGLDVLAPARDDLRIEHEDLGTVYFCIGLTADWRQQPHATVEAHVGKLAHVLDRCRFDALVYLSSTRVYKRVSTADEAHALAVLPSDADDIFDLSKLLGEALALRDPRCRVARLSNVTGDDLRSDNFVPSVIRDALAGHVLLRTSLASWKDYVLVRDTVAALHAIGERGRERIYNIASGTNTTHGEIVDVLREVTGCRVEVAAGAPISGFPAIAIERARRDLGFVPQAMLAALPRIVEEFQRSW